MQIEPTAFLYLFIFSLVATLIWLSLWLNRRRIIRRIIRRHLDRGYFRLARQTLTRAREQRLINHQDELLLRDELGLQEPL
jgi:hypothetical protein